MYADHRRVDQLHGNVMGVSKSVHDPSPDAGMPPASEAVVVGGIRTKLRQVSPWCPGAQHPEDAVEDAAIVHPWRAPRLVRQHRPDDGPFIVSEFLAPRFWGLNHGSGAILNTAWQRRFGRYAPESGSNMLTFSFVGHDPPRTSTPRMSSLPVSRCNLPPWQAAI